MARPSSWQRTCGVLALTLMSAIAHATSARYMTIPELVSASDTIILGRAGVRDSFWQGTRIFTRVQVAVDEVWVGQAPKTRVIDVLTLGGRVGDIGQHVDGVAVLPTDSRVVLHLRAIDRGEYTPVALAQGVWNVDALADDRAHIQRPSADRLVYTGPPPAPLPTTLAALKQAILEAAHGR